jgi:hypothetical protein
MGAVILTSALLAGPLMPRHVDAMYSSCRSDPKVYLSDGSVVTLTATIQDDATNVKSVEYTLHAPVWTTITNVVYTGGPFANKESLQFHADNQPGTYDSDTLVSTAASNVSVTATAQVTTPGDVVAGSISGYSNQYLYVHPTGRPGKGSHGIGHNNGSGQG